MPTACTPPVLPPCPFPRTGITVSTILPQTRMHPVAVSYQAQKPMQTAHHPRCTKRARVPLRTPCHPLFPCTFPEPRAHEQQWCRVYFARAACGAAILATTNTLTDTWGSQTGFRATANEQVGAARGVVVCARREWELTVARGRVWKAAVGYGGALRAVAVGAQREWECVVGQRGVWEAATEYGGA